MPEIIIAVQNKLPILAGAAQHIVADNSDYTIRFLFDDQWEEGEKTVYFVRSNGYTYAPVKTVDGVVQVPVQTDVNLMSQLLVGVRQGNVKTSRPCGIAVYPAISNAIKDDAVQPDESLWVNVITRLDEIEKDGVSEEKIEAAVEKYLEENPVGGGINFKPGNALSLEDGVLNVRTADTAEADNTLPITSSGVNMIVGNIGAILDTI